MVCNIITELCINISENLALNEGVYLNSTDLGQFVVKANGKKVNSAIVYFNEEYYSYYMNNVDENSARFMISLDGDYSNDEIEVIFNPDETPTILDNAGNKLEGFSFTKLRK